MVGFFVNKEERNPENIAESEPSVAPKAMAIQTDFAMEDLALLILPAPMFCAAIAEILELIATAGSIANPFNLPTAPTAADAITPSELTRAVRNKNDALVATF